MVDLANQGKGSVIKIWKTNNTNLLSKIYFICNEESESFYKPSEEFREKILKKFNLGEE